MTGGARCSSGLAFAALFSADPTASLDHFTAVRDAVANRAPSRALADGLACRARVLRQMGQTPEPAGEARRALALAREIGDPFGERQALVELSLDAEYAGDHDAGGPAGPAGRADRGRDPRRARPDVQRCADHRAEQCRGPRRSQRVGTACLSGPGRGRPVRPVLVFPKIADLDLRAAAPTPPRRTCGKGSASRCGPALA